jgi:hypothetical protein
MSVLGLVSRGDHRHDVADVGSVSFISARGATFTEEAD